MTFETYDSGHRDQFDTGYQRDTQQGKPRYDLIPMLSLKRVADLYARGAEKYGIDNWTLGSPFRRTYASLFRHLASWSLGDRSEDHLAAIVFNALTLIYYEEMIEAGKLPEHLNDMSIPLSVKGKTE